jgi:hypothetical protein
VLEISFTYKTAAMATGTQRAIFASKPRGAETNTNHGYKKHAVSEKENFLVQTNETSLNFIPA